MKKILAIALAVALVATFSVAAMAYSTPAGFEEYMDAGTWPLAAGTYYPELDNLGIPNGAHVYNAYTMDASYAATPLPVPDSIEGYTKVSSLSDLKDGTWALIDVKGYPYAFVMGEPVAAAEPEPVAEPEPAVVAEPEPAAPAAADPAPAASTPAPAAATQAPVDSKADSKTEVVKTADDSALVIFAGIAVLAAAGTLLVIRRKKVTD